MLFYHKTQTLNISYHNFHKILNKVHASLRSILFDRFGCKKVAFKFLIVKLHKAGAILFRRPKIRKTKYA